MRTVKEVADDIQYPVGVRRDLQEVLKEGAEELINRCSDMAVIAHEMNGKVEDIDAKVRTVKQQL